jgi:aromatic-L-amino-acid decarboxylase
VSPGEIASMMPGAAPESGEAWEAIEADIDRVVMPGVTHWQSPSFFGYFPCGSCYEAVLGELLSAGLGVQGMVWQSSPSCTEMETVVMDWLGRLIGLPEAFLSAGGVGGGVIQGTASEAVLVALVAARERAVRAGASGPFVVYASDQAHSSVAKAATIAGLGPAGLRRVPVDGRWRMDPSALERMIAEDRAAGRTPIMVCATLGTTGVGAVDPLGPIGEVCEREGVWLHVDAAWAGAALVCDEHRWMIEGVERADSFNFNPHKWLLVNFDCSALWVRDRRWLTDALSIDPEYLRNKASEAGVVIDFRDWQIPLGRRFRALKLWFVLRGYGAQGLRAYIREHVRLAELFEDWVRGDERFQLISRSLSLVCLTLRAGDDAARAMMERVNDGGEVFLSHTTAPVGGAERYVIRMAIGAPATREAEVRGAWDVLRAAAGSVG